MLESYKRFWNNLLNFSGTSDRPDYWWPIIINYILGAIIIAIIQSITGHPIDDIYNIADLNLSVWSKIISIVVWVGVWSLKVRRLHDTDRSGWWILISFVPLIGTIWFFVLMVLPSKRSRWS